MVWLIFSWSGVGQLSACMHKGEYFVEAFVGGNSASGGDG